MDIPELRTHGLTHQTAIITRTKNRVGFLRRCLASVAAQTSTAWQHVIVNDAGDADAVERAVKPFAQARPGQYTVIHRSVSTGMEAATNEGIRGSTSEYLIVLDDDDTLEPEFLRVMIERMSQTSSYAGVVCQSWKVTEAVAKDGEIRETGRALYNGELKFLKLFELAARNRFAVNAFLYRRSVLEDVGLYDESLRVLGDWEFNLRFLAQHDIDVLPQPLSSFHVRERGSAGAAANTVVDGAMQHFEQMAKLQNKLLRADLASGRLGLGTLMALAAAHADGTDELALRTRALTPVNKLISKLGR